MFAAIALIVLTYLAALAAAGFVAYRVLTYFLDYDARVAARRAAYVAWVLAQPAAYHDQRMIETYR